MAAAAGGLAALVAFLLVERRRPFAMLDRSLFRSRQFAGANLETALLYAALGGTFFLLPLELQLGLGYSPVRAGAALLPVTALMLALSSRMGALSRRIGPRLPMCLGPLLCAAGLALLASTIGGPRGHAGYVSTLLPGIAVFGLGLAVTVAPLTATVLAAAPTDRAGIASAINNCVARTAGLLAVAALPGLLGGAPGDGLAPESLGAGVRHGLLVAAALCLAGAAVGARFIRNPPGPQRQLGFHCPLDAPTLRLAPAAAPPD